jgi:hypothetical protein
METDAHPFAGQCFGLPAGTPVGEWESSLVGPGRIYLPGLGTENVRFEISGGSLLMIQQGGNGQDYLLGSSNNNLYANAEVHFENGDDCGGFPRQAIVTFVPPPTSLVSSPQTAQSFVYPSDWFTQGAVVWSEPATCTYRLHLHLPICLACSPGWTRPRTEQWNAGCYQCAPNTYKTTTSHEACTACPSGESALGSTSIQDCVSTTIAFLLYSNE